MPDIQKKILIDVEAVKEKLLEPFHIRIETLALEIEDLIDGCQTAYHTEEGPDIRLLAMRSQALAAKVVELATIDWMVRS